MAEEECAVLKIEFESALVDHRESFDNVRLFGESELEQNLEDARFNLGDNRSLRCINTWNFGSFNCDDQCALMENFVVLEIVN
jgi:hypothetical protein